MFYDLISSNFSDIFSDQNLNVMFHIKTAIEIKN